MAHYATTLGSRQIFIADNAQTEGDALGTALADLCEHAQVPVSVIR
jgi:hypothetical protein